MKIILFRLHKTYHFECSCEACRNEWPTISNLPSNVGKSTCYKDKSEIHKPQSLLKVNEKKLKKKSCPNHEKVLILIECIKIAESTLKRPHALFCQLENELHQCLIALYSENNTLEEKIA